MDTLPVYIVNDDEDDHLFIEEIWEELRIPNELRFFKQGEELIKVLKEGISPFIIISDVNLPKTDGFELREQLINDASMKTKSIPFIFWSAQASKKQIKKAYDLSVHGFFIKESNFEQVKETFKRIIQYWMRSKAPEKL